MCLVVAKAQSKDTKRCSKSSLKPKAVAADIVQDAKPVIASMSDVSAETKKAEKRPKGKKLNVRNNRKRAKKTENDDEDFENRESLLSSNKLTAAEKATYD